MSIAHGLATIVTRQHQRQTNILGGGQVRQQMMKLKDHTNLLVAVTSEFGARGAMDRKLAEFDSSVIGSLDPADEMKQS